VGCQPIGAHHLETADRHLDGQWDAIDLLADACGSGRRYLIKGKALDDSRGALHEQLNRGVIEGRRRRYSLGVSRKVQVRHAIEALADNRQTFAACRQDRDGRASSQQRLCQCRRRGHQVLAVVEDQQQLFLVEMGNHTFQGRPITWKWHPQCRTQRFPNQCRIGNRSQFHQPDAVGISANEPEARLYGNACLAGAA